MVYSAAALRLLGYNLRNKEYWNDYTSHTMDVWLKFSDDHSESNFAWLTQSGHRNLHNVTHGGALMSYMDSCMMAHIWDCFAGKYSYTKELNNKFIRPARINRLLFASVKGTVVDNQIELHGEIHANDPAGMLIMKSFGIFTLPKAPKVIDSIL